MSLRRACLAMLLVAALTATALPATAGLAGGPSAGGDAGGHAEPVAAGRARADGSLPRLSGDERRDGPGSERTPAPRLALVASLTALLAAAAGARAGGAAHRRRHRPPVPWWAPGPGRSPPPLRSPIA